MAHDSHPSDETLIRAADGELPAARHAVVVQHLLSCEACTARQGQLRRAVEAFGGARREAGASARVSDLFRARVHANVTRLSREVEASRSRRLLAGPRSLPSKGAATAIVAAAVVLLVAASVLQPHLGRVAKDETLLAVQSGVLPVPSLTPGATRPVHLSELCGGGAAAERPISTEVRQAVLRDYQMEGVPAHEYELDYLITPELGGSDDRRNLWPERYSSRTWNALVKDELERLLPELVCRGEVDLATAQRDIAVNWIAAYKKYFRSDRPVGPRAGVRTSHLSVPVLVSLFINAPAIQPRADW